MAVAAFFGPLPLTLASAALALVVAIGWPRLLDIPVHGGTRVVIGIAGVGAVAATAATPGEPALRYLPVVLALSIVLAFVAELLRRDVVRGLDRDRAHRRGRVARRDVRGRARGRVGGLGAPARRVGQRGARARARGRRGRSRRLRDAGPRPRQRRVVGGRGGPARRLAPRAVRPAARAARAPRRVLRDGAARRRRRHADLRRRAGDRRVSPQTAVPAVVLVVVLVATVALGVWWQRRQGVVRTGARRAAGARVPGGSAADDARPAVDWAARGVELGPRRTFVQFSAQVCAPCRATARVLAE